MRKIALTQGKFSLVDDADFEYVSKYKWYYSHGYAMRDTSLGRVYMHRVINKTPVGMVTDHLDRDGLNNQSSNLVAKTHAHNIYNQALSPRNTSGHKGISWARNVKKWHVYIGGRKDRRNVGYFNSLSEAVKAHRSAEREYLCV